MYGYFVRAVTRFGETEESPANMRRKLAAEMLVRDTPYTWNSIGFVFRPKKKKSNRISNKILLQPETSRNPPSATSAALGPRPWRGHPHREDD